MNIKSIFSCFILVLCFNITNTNAQTSVSEDVKSLIKKKRTYNKENGYGFRIQLYYGFETKAKTELKKFKLEFPKIRTHIDLKLD